MSLTITDPSFDKVYTMYAWRDNNIRFVLTQGEGATGTDGTISHVKVAKFQLRDDRGIIDLTSCEVLLALTRPDGSEDLLACSSTSGEAAQGIISCPITASATAIAGQAIGEIRVLSASSGNPTGIIKFFGVHFQIYEGVSDDAAEQSTQFSALTAELQKVALLTPEGTAEMDDTLEHGGTNPVASGIIFDNTMKYKYIQASEINDSTRADYVYHGIDEVGYYFVMICVRNPDGSRKTQYKFYTSSPTSINNGKIVFRTYNNITSTWGDWTPIGNTGNIADDAVTNEKIADDAITNEKIRDNEISLEKLNFDIPDISEGIISKAIIENYDSLTPDVTFDAVNDDVAEYLNSTAYTFTTDNAYNSNDYASTNIPDSMDGSVSELPNGGMINVPTGGSKIVIYDTVENTQWVDDLSGNTYTIKNLIPNRLYTYIIKDSNGDTLRSGSCKASGQVRFIDAGKATTYFTTDPSTTFERPIFNIRDLGGWACDGGHLKYGLIYRGCRLNGNYTSGQTRYGISISPEQIDFFKNFLGIRDEIDFRQLKNDPDTGNTETAGDDAVYETADDIKDTALGIGVDYTIIPLNPYIKGIEIKSSNADMNRRYANVIKRIARDISDKKPCYIHCLEGADRTGTVTMLILAICGVSRSDIERDYELTSFSKDYAGNRDRRARNDTDYRWMNLMVYLLGSNFTGATFRDKIIDYVLKIGVTIEEINTIRAGLIDGAPEKIKNPNSDVSVTYNLTNINTDNPISLIAMYQPFEATLTALNMKEIQSVTVLMGNTDITSTAYVQEKISIPRVTGDISITASASDVDIYSKPSGGIPKTDLASSVQTSLGKADSAMQPDDVNSKYPVEFAPHAGLIDARDLSLYGYSSLGNYHTSIGVSAGERYIINCRSSSSVYPGAFYTLNGVKVSAIFEDNATHLNAEITVPSGVDTLWLNSKSSIIALDDWKVYKIISAADYTEENNSRIAALEVSRTDEQVETLRRLRNLEKRGSTFCWKPFDKAYYCFVNDGTKAHIHLYYDIFHSHNIPLVAAAVGENIELANDTETTPGGRTVKQTLDAIVADGGEVMTYLNAAALLSTDPFSLWYEYAVKNGKRLIESYGYNVRGLILSAQSARNSSIGQEICERFFDYSDRVGTLHSQYDINRKQFSDTATVADVKAYIDSTVNTPGFYPILFHRPSQDPWATTEGMNEILTYIEGKGSAAAVSTYSYVFDTFGSNGYLTLDDLPVYDGGVQ